MQLLPASWYPVWEQLLLFANQHRLLPDAYVYGAADVVSGLVQCYAFLRGQYSSTGFRGTYFLWTFLLKTRLSQCF